jgi:hypothetical protein
MTKEELIQEIGRINGEIAKAEATLRDWERGAEAAGRNAWVAVTAMLLGGGGALYFFFGTRWWLFGGNLACAAACALVGAIGLLLTFTESARRSKFERAVNDLREKVSEHRSNLAMMQARLTAGE